MSERVLVTGCCGFIGANLVRRLIRMGYLVDGVDDFSNGSVNSVSDLNYRIVYAGMSDIYVRKEDPKNPDLVIFQGDFSNHKILNLVNSGRYNYVFHLAARPRVQWTVENPVTSNDINLNSTLRLFTAAKGNVKKIIFSSTSAIYGNTDTLPSSELHPSAPTNPYAGQKLFCEVYGKMFGDLYGLEVVSLRYFNVFGPGQFGNSPYSTAIAAWCQCAHDNKPFRSDGDGEQSRDMIYVDDIIDANIAALNAKEDLSGEVFNIGTGISYTNNEILKIFLEKFPATEIKQAAARLGDVRHTRGDITKAKEKLGWSPKTNLKQGLKETFKWWNF